MTGWPAIVIEPGTDREERLTLDEARRRGVKVTDPFMQQWIDELLAETE